MKVLHHVLGIMAGIALVVILLITSFEVAMYSDFGWYEKEYAKYDVISDMDMEMSDVMEVTEEMMAYLRGDREDLVVHTVIAGEEREFFNDREKAHMVDVQGLFLGGLALRRGGIVCVIAAVGILLVTKADWKKILPKTVLMGMGAVIAATAAFGMLCVYDFNKYFTLFHEIFFDNDLWILNPKTDWLIRMLPEKFFFDMVIRIGSMFLISLVVMSAICVWAILKQRNKKNL